MTDRTAPRVQRSRLGAELRRLRKLAGISGRAAAGHVGIGQASVSRIEAGQQVPSMPEVRAWAEAVEATPEQRQHLEELTEAALNEVEQWRARQQAGLPTMQADTQYLEATARTMIGFQPTIVPGLLQTAEYARRVFEVVDVVGGLDYPGAVQARLERQRILYEQDRRFEFLISEEALRRRIVSADILTAQLHHIASMATLPTITIGIIPTEAPVRALPWCGFNLHDDVDDNQPPYVMIEMAHAGITVSDPDDVAIYRQQIQLLRETALRHETATRLLSHLTNRLQHAEDSEG